MNFLGLDFFSFFEMVNINNLFWVIHLLAVLQQEMVSSNI